MGSLEGIDDGILDGSELGISEGTELGSLEGIDDGKLNGSVEGTIPVPPPLFLVSILVHVFFIHKAQLNLPIATCHVRRNSVRIGPILSIKWALICICKSFLIPCTIVSICIFKAVPISTECRGERRL